MDKVLKVYPDGHQLTVKEATMLAGVCLVTGTVTAIVVTKLSDWRYSRNVRKFEKYLEEQNSK